MRCRPTTSRSSAADRRRAGFTLAEALAALVFLAVVIPVTVQAVQVASRAAQVADWKTAASRIADRLLNEVIVTEQWKQASGSGTVLEGTRQYRWTLQSQSWDKDSLRLLTVRVTYLVQGQEYDVRLSTLVDGTAVQ